MAHNAIAGLLTEQGHMERLAELQFELTWIQAQGAAGDATAAARYAALYQGAMLPATGDAVRYFGRYGDAYAYMAPDVVALANIYFADVVSGEDRPAAAPDCDDCFGSGIAVGYDDFDRLAPVPCSCVTTGRPVQSVAVESAAAAPVDDDPKCVCGVHRSEHQLCGCEDGFQSPASWAAESAAIARMDEWEFERRYGRSH